MCACAPSRGPLSQLLSFSRQGRDPRSQKLISHSCFHHSLCDGSHGSGFAIGCVTVSNLRNFSVPRFPPSSFKLVMTSQGWHADSVSQSSKHLLGCVPTALLNFLLLLLSIAIIIEVRLFTELMILICSQVLGLQVCTTISD